jgi:MFS family permease
VEPALFRLRAFSAGMGVGLAFFAGMTGLILALGLYLQLGLGYTPLQAGLTQAPWALGVAIGSALSGAVLAARFGRTGLQVGALVMIAGIGVLVPTISLTAGAVTGWQLAPGLLVCGFGMGMVMTPFFDITLAGVTLPLVGSASGVLNANQQLGGAAGIAVLGTVFFDLFDKGRATSAIDAVLVASAGLVLVAAALAFLLPRRSAAAVEAH